MRVVLTNQQREIFSMNNNKQLFTEVEVNRETIVAICEKIWQYTDKSHFVLLRLLGGEWYLADHLRASQPARAKSTIHLCGIY